MEGAIAWHTTNTLKEWPMKIVYFRSLVLLIVPSLIIGMIMLRPHYGDVKLMAGFFVLLAATCFSYWLGLRHVIKDIRES